jgi:hypothetical protein
VTASLFPTTVPAITPAWLTDVLRQGGYLAAGVVTQAAATPFGAGEAVLSSLARLTLTYNPPDAGPRTLIAKVPTANPDNLRFARGTRAYACEVNFYRELAARSPLRVPQCYAAALDQLSGDFVLLLEDLGTARAVDPLVGCTPADAETVVVALSRLHAAWWNHPSLAALTWLGAYSDPRVVQGNAAAFGATWPRFLARFADGSPAPALAIGTALTERMGDVVMRLGGPPHTLCHGDPLLDNLLFDLPDSALAVVDWQFCCRAGGVFDLADFLTYSLDSATRRVHERALLRRYHQVLGDGGVTDYAFDRCLEDYRWAVLYCYRRAAATARVDPGDARGEALFASFRERCFAANLDWETGALLMT